MADGTKIEWTEATWNPITGCSLHSPGCTNCYAMDLAGTRLADHPSRAGLTQPSKAGPVWTGEVRFNEQWLDQPLRWKRPRMIFVCAHGDLFHESVPDEWIDRVFAVMALCPQHTFQVLTKRSARMREYIISRFGGWGEMLLCDAIEALGGFEDDAGGEWGKPLPNVWLGVSVEDQQRADERIPDLLATPAAIRWISAEPLLGPVDLLKFMDAEPGNVGTQGDAPRSDDCSAVTSGRAGAGGVVARPAPRIDWAVIGGESGRGARPMHPDWARSLRDQCAAAGVPFFFKQWGEWLPAGDHLSEDVPEYLRLRAGTRTHVFKDDHQQMAAVGKKRAGRLLDGVEHNAMPGDKV